MAKRKRNYAQEEQLNDTPAQRKLQALRMRARRKMEKEGKVRKYDNKQVDHIKFASRGGGNSDKNLRVVSDHVNMSRQPKKRKK